MIKRVAMAIFQLPILKNFNLLVSGRLFLQIPKDLGSHPESPNLSRLVASSLPRQEYSKLCKRQRSGILSNDMKTIIIRSCQEFLCFHFGWSAVTLESPTKPSLIFIDEQIQVDPIQNGKNTISIQTEIKGFAWLFTADINELNHKRNRSTAGKKRS